MKMFHECLILFNIIGAIMLNNNASILSCLNVGGALGMGGIIWGLRLFLKLLKLGESKSNDIVEPWKFNRKMGERLLMA